MASRPVFIPHTEGPNLVTQKVVDFQWFPGFSLKQKHKSIESFHAAAEAQYDLAPLLEISSKSPEELGTHLSAFNLRLQLPGLPSATSVESAFQGSKVFECDGPFIDLYRKPASEAKKDARLRNSGDLRNFQLGDERWPLEPKTAFYDWLYLNALRLHVDQAEKLLHYVGFTDIEFNPKRSINCQAQSAALYVALYRRNLLPDALRSRDTFLGCRGSFAACSQP